MDLKNKSAVNREGGFWLKKSKDIQWDYTNVVKNKGLLKLK
jgi:hypothetical protein